MSSFLLKINRSITAVLALSLSITACSSDQKSESRVTSGSSGDANPTVPGPTNTPSVDLPPSDPSVPTDGGNQAGLIALDGTGTFSGSANGKSFTMSNAFVSITKDKRSLGFVISHSNLSTYMSLNSNCSGLLKYPQYADEKDHRSIQVGVSRDNLNKISATYYFDEGYNQQLNVFNDSNSTITVTEETETRVKATIHLKGPNSDIQGTVDAPKCFLNF